MRHFGRQLVFVVALAMISTAPWSLASQVVTTRHVRVVFDGPHLEPLARRVAATAEAALVRVAELFVVEPFPVSLTLTDATDVFNALATPLPRPTVVLRTAAPVDLGIGLDAASWLELVIVHELTHLAHFTRTDAPTFGLGFVGDGLAPPPPLWLIEGIATWVESELTSGGRVGGARTAGLLSTLALGEAWPSLAEAGTGTHGSWPGGETRYLLGAAFLDRLVAAHGWDTVIRAIEDFNHGSLARPFAAAWDQTTGSDLHAEWAAWRSELATAAQARAEAIPEPPVRLTETGWHTGLPASSPAGDRVAWRTWPPAVAVAPVAREESGVMVLGGRTTHLQGTLVRSLDWLDETSLIYTRIHQTSSSAYAEVYRLDLETGREERLTTGARALFARADGTSGCVVWVRAVASEASALMRACRGEAGRPLWIAPAGEEIVGLDVADDGRIVMSVWDRGMVGLAVLEAAGSDARSERVRRDPEPDGRDAHGGGLGLRFLTFDRFLDLAPVWTREGAIRFRSDRTGRFEIYEVDPDGVPAAAEEIVVSQLTETLGGAFEATRDGLIVTLGAGGFDLAVLPERPVREVAARLEERSDRAPESLAGPAVPYTPWSTLAPFGWMPTRTMVAFDPARVGLEVAVLGQDASAEHAYALTFGVDTGLDGWLGPGYAFLRYDWNPTGLFASVFPTPRYSLSVQAGMWPYVPQRAAPTEMALGARATGTMRWRGDGYAAGAVLGVGVVHLESRGGVLPEAELTATISTGGSDRWGYPTAGVHVDLSGRWTPVAAGATAGALAGATARADAFGGSIAAGMYARWQLPASAPVGLGSLAWALEAGGRWSIPVGLHHGDGRYSLQRVTFAPALRAGTDGTRGTRGGLGAESHEASLRYGVDLTVGADLLLSYAAPVTIAVRVGWSGDFFVELGTSFAQ